MPWLSLPTGLLPVVLLLGGMLVLDSYKLVTTKLVLRSVGFGGAAAVAAWGLNRLAIDLAAVPPDTLRRWIAPVLEEGLKLSWIALLIRRRRVAFLVDAGIHGFAVGTGFAVVENLYYAATLGRTGILLWVARGLGTAVMHGVATGVGAILARELTERRGSNSWKWFGPGVAAAAMVHSVFNQLPFPPLVSTACVVLGAPIILIVTYETSERRTRRWLGATLDRDIELLDDIRRGTITETPVGFYLASVRQHFPGPVVADMLCLLEIQAQLALRAKGILIAREAGLELPVDDAVRANLEELKYLRKNIGKTGMMAILPFLGTSDRDLWQLQLLKK